MPCYDPRSDDTKYTKKDRKEIDALIDENKKLEAGLCAIITELVKRDLASQIIPEASRNGLVDLVGFWNDHHESDQSRLAFELHKFSVHEQEQLKRLLNDNLNLK